MKKIDWSKYYRKYTPEIRVTPFSKNLKQKSKEAALLSDKPFYQWAIEAFKEKIKRDEK